MVDEAHCILTWGKSDFGPAFLNLASLRAIVPHSKVLALTATAPSGAQGEISKALLMKKTIIGGCFTGQVRSLLVVILHPYHAKYKLY